MLLLWSSGPLAAAPKFFLSPSSLSLGPVLAGTEATRELAIQNRGDGALSILLLHSNCRCLDGEISDTTLAAGARARLRLRFRARVQPGTEEAELLLRTDDPAARQVRVPVSAFVYQKVMLEPEVFQLRAAQRGRRYAQPFMLYHWDRVPLVASVSGELPAGVRVIWEKPDPARPWIAAGTVEYAVPAAIAPKKLLQETVEFSTDCPDRPVVPLALSGYVAGAISAEPERLSFGVVSGAAAVSRQFTLRCDPPYRLDGAPGVEITVADRSLRVEQIASASREARFRVTLAPAGAARQLRTRLAVNVPGTDLPQLEIPVRAVLVP